ncbi:MAG: tetratricopeptide repeat protein [Acidobacteria bacterium]|nr:tetratricopeptide repeat protein [Acidobacteriota bacterium]
MKARSAHWSFSVLAVAVLFFLPSMLRSQTTAADSIERLFQDAMAAEDRGELTKAEMLLRGVHEKHPGIFAVDESLGLLYVQQAKFEAALPLLKSGVDEQPNSDAAHANYGAALYQLHRNQEALVEFQAAARLNPKNGSTQESLGRLLMEEHHPIEAAEAFSAASKALPEKTDLVHDRALALIQAGRASQAVAELNVLPGSEQSAVAQSLIGDAEEKLGSYQRAAEHYARAVELEPSEPNVWELGLEFLRHWTFEPAIKEFEAGTAKFPDSTRMKLGLGSAYFGGSQYAKSIPVFADLLISDPNSALYAELLGMACTAVSEGSRSRCSELVQYAEAHPRNAKTSTYAASMLLAGVADDEHNRKASKLLASALAVDPRSAEAHYQMGLLKQNEGDWPGSVSSLEKAIALKPDLATAHYRLALAYWRSGRKEEGQAQMELQKKYSRQQKADLDHRLKEITTFIVDVRNQ